MKVVRLRLPELGLELDQLHAGPAMVTCIPDMANTTWPAQEIFAALTSESLAEAARYSPDETVDPRAGTIMLSFNCYVIQTPHYVALIDGGIGDGKERPHRPAWHRRESGFLATLAAIGVSSEDIDIVVNTHLHADHVGWNTRWDGDGWRPTFPKARYVVAATELDFWMKQHMAAPDGNTLHGAFADSVLPIIDSVGFETVATDAPVAAGLRFKPAPGHTPGMVAVSLAADAGEVLFMSDAIHHPLQLGDPDIACNFCADPTEAGATRRRLLAAAAAERSVLAPYHFPAPVFGRLVSEAAGFYFEPL